jgi:hypothetical protein
MSTSAAASGASVHLGHQAVADGDLVGADQRPDAEVDTGLSLYFATMSASSAPSSTVATSEMRTTAPPRSVTISLLELLHRTQVGVGEQVDLHEVALRLADGGQVVVALDRRVDVAGRQVDGGEAVRVDPDAHRDRPTAFAGC